MQSLEMLRPCQPVDATATVLSSQLITPTIKSMRLRLDNPAFRFLPGQSVWPRFQREGKQFSKIYSIASSPSQCPEIELCVSRVGWSSAYLHDLPLGGTISVRGPYGLMTLRSLPQRPRLYLAEGSGIAPLKSQIDWLRESGFQHPIYLIQSNPETVDQLPYAAYWRFLSSCQQQPAPVPLHPPAFSYHEAIAARPEEVLARLNLDLSAMEVEICAVGDRTAQLQAAVLSLGAHPAQVRSERFYAF